MSVEGSLGDEVGDRVVLVGVSALRPLQIYILELMILTL